MIRRWFCRHPHTIRERVSGVLHFTCASCGHRAPAIDRTGEVLTPREFSAPVQARKVLPMRARRRA